MKTKIPVPKFTIGQTFWYLREEYKPVPEKICKICKMYVKPNEQNNILAWRPYQDNVCSINIRFDEYNSRIDYTSVCSGKEYSELGGRHKMFATEKEATTYAKKLNKKCIKYAKRNTK
jgi:hypothetical protein